MNKLNKYVTLAVLLMIGLLSIIGVIVIIYYVLKLISIALFNLPGSNSVFHVFIVLAPYIIYFSAYYYLRTKIAAASNKSVRLIAWALFTAGSFICFTCMIFSLLVFMKIKNEWLNLFDDNSQYVLITQIILLFSIAAVAASGDTKEKSWMEKNNS